MKQKVGRKRKEVYRSILNDYEHLEDKVITLPETINQDIGFEMQFGLKRIDRAREYNYLIKKKCIKE